MNAPVLPPPIGEVGVRKVPQVDISRLSFPKKIWAALKEYISFPPYRMILLGPPGVGKGTIAKILKCLWRVPHISTGEILRAEVNSGSDLGKQAAPFMLTGLVPDYLVTPIVVKWLGSPAAKRGFIFDGFPRTVAQAEALDAALKALSLKLDAIVELTAPESLLVDRMLKRGREGETASTIRSRLETDRAETAPVAQYYRNRLGVVTVDGVGSGDEVASRVDNALSPRKWFQALLLPKSRFGNAR